MTSEHEQREPMNDSPECAFYSVSDSRHFLGAVALLNSLRLVGHTEPFFLVDAGLTAEQRELLRRHATLLPAPEVHPIFVGPTGPMQKPADVAVLFDADIIVVRPLTELIDAARAGRIVSFVNDPPNHDRFFAEWEAALALQPRCGGPYLNAGQLFVPATLSRRLFEPWVEGQMKLDLEGTWLGKGHLEDPFYFADQDVLNAVLRSEFAADELMTMDYRLAPHPPFEELRMVDSARMVCRYSDGVEPFLLHHTHAKPWLTATRSSIYTRLLTRLLLASDVALPLTPEDLPPRLRVGTLANIDRCRASMQASSYAYARKRLGTFGIRTRVRAWRRSHRRESG